jgi:hypothetical protein
MILPDAPPRRLSVLTGLPLSGALMTWSFWYSVRKIRPLFVSAAVAR